MAKVRKDSKGEYEEVPTEEQEQKQDTGVEEVGKALGVETVPVEVLKEGDELFMSHGFSNVKVTKGSVVQNVRLPIKSSGVTELIESFKAQEPKPPVIDEIVKKDSDIGRQLRLTKDTQVKVPNLGDPEYIRKLDEYESKLGIAILQKGLAVNFQDRHGKNVIDDNKKIEILKGMGMSGGQFTQVVQDIRTLTEWDEEEKRNFFGMS